MTTGINLFVIYKHLSRRVTQARSEQARVLAEAIQVHAAALLEDPRLSRIKSIRAAEERWFQVAKGPRKSYADEFERVICSGDFYVERPFIKNFSVGWDPDTGTVYCAAVPERPGQVKLGATTMDIGKRLQKFCYRFGYSGINLLHSARVNRPARVEKAAQELLRRFRVAGHAKGASVEWYAVHPKQAIAAIKKAIIATNQIQ